MSDRDLLTAIVLACVASGHRVDIEHAKRLMAALKIELEKL